MPAVVGTKGAVQRVEANLRGLAGAIRKVKALEEAILGGDVLQFIEPVVKRFISRAISKNFRDKKAVGNKDFRATRPKRSYVNWIRKMLLAKTEINVGSEFRQVLHPATSRWAGRRTDHLYEKMFKGGDLLQRGINVGLDSSKTRIKATFEARPIRLEEFLNQYPLSFFRAGNDPFFLTKDQQKELKREVDPIFKKIGFTVSG